MKGNIFNVFLMGKPCAILSVLRNAEGEIYTSEVARRVKCTYSHTRKILLCLEENGLVNFKKQGRIRKIDLTEKGEKIAEHFEKIEELQNV